MKIEFDIDGTAICNGVRIRLTREMIQDLSLYGFNIDIEYYYLDAIKDKRCETINKILELSDKDSDN